MARMKKKKPIGQPKIPMKLLQSITDNEPNRYMGPLEQLKKSLTERGLINPLTIDTTGRLLAGRRRYRAMIELGWTECLVRILDTEDELEALMISIHENTRRKPLTEPENRRMIVELDARMRKKAEAKAELSNDQSNKSESRPAHRPKEAWTDTDTAKEFGTSHKTVSEAKRAEKHIEEFPKLNDEKTPVVLAHRRKEKILATLSKDDADYFKTEEKDLDWFELKEKIEQAKEIEKTIEEIPEARLGFKRRMEKTYRNPYTKYDTTLAEVEKAIRKDIGLTADDRRKVIDDLDRELSNWQDRWRDEYPELINVFNVREWRKEIRKFRDSIKPLKRINCPIEQFYTRTGAERFARKRGGYCSGRGIIAGEEVWIIYVEQ